MKTTKLFVCAALAVMVLGSCNKKENALGVSHDYLPVQMSKGDNWSIINKDGEIVVKEEYAADAQLSRVYDGVFWIKQNDKYQLFSLDSPKKPIIDEEFTRVTKFSAGVAAVSSPNKPIRIIDTKGTTIVTLPKTIKRCYAFSDNGYAVYVDTDDREGLLDARGNIAIKAEYAGVLGEREGLVVTYKNFEDNKFLVLDTKGQKQGEINNEKFTLHSFVFNEGKIMACQADDENSPLVALDKTGKKQFDIKKSAKQSPISVYLDGFLIFCNEDGKYGVADDKGEVVIRPKYERMFNWGNGLFRAKKNDKVGVVNAEDKAIVDFDYDGGVCRMGSNFVMVDGSEYALISKDGKEIVSFEEYSLEVGDSYAEYIDIEGLTNAAAKMLLKYGEPRTAVQIATEGKLNIDEWHYKSVINNTQDVDGKIKADVNIYFDGYMAEEKTHQEEVNDGWFTTARTVSDGWVWSDYVTSSISGSLTLNEVGSKADVFCKGLFDKLEEASYRKIDDNSYSKNMKLGDKTYESRITLTPEDDKINVQIDFNE